MFGGNWSCSRFVSPPVNSPTAPSLGTRVVEAIAEAKGSDTSDVGPLYEVIDLEALESLYAHSGSEWRVEFHVDGDRVVVRDDGTIDVDARTDGPPIRPRG